MHMGSIIDAFEAAGKDSAESIRASIIDHHIILKVPTAERHYWSPQLSLELEAHHGGTLIRGLFGPKPAVWTMFMFLYAAVGFFTLMGLIFGLSQMMIDQTPWALWSFPAGVGIILIIYMVARAGRAIGSEQMHMLHRHYQAIVGTEEKSEA
jgi:hypothetical protein